MALLPLPDVHDAAVRAAAVAAGRRPLHPAVANTLQVHTEAQRRSLTALQEGVCVVTGQQAGLFGGPLYTLHKAVAAIVNARTLEAETGVPCAPVFWLQDEDHDFDEIRQTSVLDADGGRVGLAVDGLPTEQGCSVAHRVLGPSIDTALGGMEEALAGLPHAEEVVQLLRATHSPTTTVAAAFRAGVERLFSAHGLLVLDPMHPELVEAARAVHARAIHDAPALSAALLTQVEALGEAPVHVRPDAPLSFVHPDGIHRPRHRVEPAGDAYRTCDTGAPLSREAVERGPHTTSALLRPVLQDLLLPTAAYVGGPGELRYLAQLPPLWQAFGLPTPLVALRARFVLLDGPTRRSLAKLGLPLASLGLGRRELLTRLDPNRSGRPDPASVERALLEGALAALAAFEPHADALGDGLPRAVSKTRHHLEHGVGKLVDRYRRTLTRNDAALVQHLDRVLGALRPDGAPQERVLGWPSFAARIGIDALVERLIAEAVPFDGTLREVHL